MVECSLRALAAICSRSAFIQCVLKEHDLDHNIKPTIVAVEEGAPIAQSLTLENSNNL